MVKKPPLSIITKHYIQPIPCSPSPKFERNIMCSFCSTKSPHLPLVFPLHCPKTSKKQNRHLRLGLLNRRRALVQETRQRNRMIAVKEEIEMKNLKLYLENKSIIEENDKLRKQAMLLHKENQDLLSQLQKKFSEQHNNKA